MDVRITPESKVTADHSVRCYEVDGAMRLKPAAFMDLAQDMADLAADAMHFGYEEMIRENKAWVLSRLHFVFEDVPCCREDAIAGQTGKVALPRGAAAVEAGRRTVAYSDVDLQGHSAPANRRTALLLWQS